MFHRIHLNFHQRAVILHDGKAVRALGPGTHAFWKHHDVIRWDTDAPAFTAPAAVLAVLPPGVVRDRAPRSRPVRHRRARRAPGRVPAPRRPPDMKDIAEKIDEIKLVMGLDGMKAFLPLANGKTDN
jgi:hypothetical protein